MISDSDGTKLQVGYKQTMRALNESKALRVFLAMDSDDKIIRSVREQCGLKNVETEEVDTMRELGEKCGIEVKASCAVLIK
ncbi:MAG: ribosomal L7Ae/L30e/S12e/Gadd45 family protein [Oscillospiraceae bacterium]|nr:ribosomal L7Ae/L30e/S12e/Gadd45 family protein [Oscillospiraceae bacterium]